MWNQLLTCHLFLILTLASFNYKLFNCTFGMYYELSKPYLSYLPSCLKFSRCIREYIISGHMHIVVSDSSLMMWLLFCQEFFLVMYKFLVAGANHKPFFSNRNAKMDLHSRTINFAILSLSPHFEFEMKSFV